MMDKTMDMNRELMLDGNAVGGVLHDIFALEMTAAPAECAHCGNVAEVGALLAFTQAPGIVLRCPVCEEVVMRIVVTDDSIYFDARGVAYLRMSKPGE
jgi:hypothetical protein